jgi:hypothetical protein
MPEPFVPFVPFMPPLRRPVRTVDAAEIRDVDHFYGAFADQPLRIRDALDPASRLHHIPLAELARSITGPLESYDPGSDRPLTVPAEDVFTALARGTPGPNIVDHSIVDTPLAAELQLPHFLTRDWFVRIPGHACMQKNLVCSPAGSFSPIHVDAYGMQGWLHLAGGQKHWTLYAPIHVPLLYDVSFRQFLDARAWDRERLPLAPLAEAYTATQEPGDLIYVPAGWPHQVVTPAPSWGFGGSLLNAERIDVHVQVWLWERTLGVHSEIDLAAELRRLAPELAPDDPARARVARSEALILAWERRNAALAGA